LAEILIGQLISSPRQKNIKDKIKKKDEKGKQTLKMKKMICHKCA